MQADQCQPGGASPAPSGADPFADPMEGCPPVPSVIVASSAKPASGSSEEGSALVGTIGFLLVVLVPILLGVLWVAWRRRSGLVDTPTTACGALTPGLREAVGTAVAVERPFRAPLSQKPCVWFAWRVERFETRPKGGSSWVPVEAGATAAPFWLDDGTGRVLVRPRGAQVDPDAMVNPVGLGHAPPYSRWQLRRWSLIGEDRAERAASVAEGTVTATATDRKWWKAGTGDPIADMAGRIRTIEQVIEPGAVLHVRGRMEARAVGGVQFAGRPGRLHLSSKSEEATVSGATRLIRLTVVPTLIGAAAAGPLIGYGLDGTIEPLWSLFLLGPVAALAGLAWILRKRERAQAAPTDGRAGPVAMGAGPAPVPVEPSTTWGTAAADGSAPARWPAPWEPTGLGVAPLPGSPEPAGPISDG